ncbi:MAG: tRNA (adenosine(37)-N6)-dimethylallyltransferase MiaA [Muribaculaceae bacterium]|nr:tRNA (adenosine(37)-N6)-dimethylallyltransferase MiaA [Muribaculaceae bacterium]
MIGRNQQRPVLIVVTGPTGSGKTALAIDIARRLDCEIISADSRQIFSEIPITTAAPTPDELAAARHHFVGTLSVEDYFSAAMFEDQALRLLKRLWQNNRFAVMAGGSMMYIDAVVNGIDELPTITDAVRQQVASMYQEHGLDYMVDYLRRLDPAAEGRVDMRNPRRVVHAIEICLQAGEPYSRLCTGRRKPRDFDVIKLAISLPRDILFDRINRRVDAMVAAGMIDEVTRLYDRRTLNSLNTVGCKEIFAMLDGTMDRETAIARIAKNTRVYAKKQMTWLQRDPTVIYLDGTRPLLPAALAAIPPTI